MSKITLQAEVRNVFGKSVNRLRATGKVPGVYYVHGEPNIPITVKEPALKPLIYTSETHILSLRLDDGKEFSCILRDVQFDPVTDKPVHFDLQGLKTDEKVTLEIPVAIKGTAAGVQEGGILQHIIHKLKISCLPKDIPDHIEVDVEHLGMNQSIHVRDLAEGAYMMLESEDSTVIAVVPPTVVKEEVPAEAVALEPTEPEVIAKGKKPEEEEEVEQPKQPATTKEDSKPEKK
ncbi:MAG: 50S ribosomal protein L25 [Bacteroidota bacterium]